MLLTSVFKTEGYLYFLGPTIILELVISNGKKGQL